ncbi:MAG: hypothetical protein HLUCCA01_05305 [Bacteroidetes bacterium HLUCCA01]|nr:MAG: hypothetical protein HLUCCA01_05305 [Bacteroidetes bacterium HLUCCA01]
MNSVIPICTISFIYGIARGGRPMNYPLGTDSARESREKQIGQEGPGNSSAAQKLIPAPNESVLK